MKSSEIDKAKLKATADGTTSASPVKRRIALVVAIISMCFMLTGCSFGFVETISGIPLIGDGLASLMVNVATMPADPSHSLLETVVDYSYIDDISQSLLISNGAKLSGAQSTDIITNLWKYVQEVYDRLSGVGIALCTTFFIISVISMATKDNTTLEHYIKELIKLMIAIAVLTNLIFIINGIMGIGDNALKMINGTEYTNSKPDLKQHRWELLMGNKNIWDNVTGMGGSNHDALMIDGAEVVELSDTFQSFTGYSWNYKMNDLISHFVSGFTMSGAKLDSYNNSSTNPFAGGINGYDPDESWSESGSSDWQGVYKKFCTIIICTKASMHAQDTIDNYGMLGAMGNWFACLAFVLVLAFASLVARIAAYFAAYQRLLEISWRVVFAPIGCANMFDGAGANTPGVRYLKTLFGVCLSGVLLIVILKIGTGLANDILIECCQHYNGSLLIAAIAVKLATIGAAMGVSAKVKEVMS